MLELALNERNLNSGSAANLKGVFHGNCPQFSLKLLVKVIKDFNKIVRKLAKL